jgi:hypothetical protein
MAVGLTAPIGCPICPIILFQSVIKAIDVAGWGGGKKWVPCKLSRALSEFLALKIFRC